MELGTYFERIGFGGEARPDLDTLRTLQELHVASVPFENLDVQLGRPVTTAVADAYRKIVAARRGGWCYEQNGLFGWVLVEIGFDVTRVAADVMRQVRGEASIANHLCLLVTWPEASAAYLVDVGFGGSMIEPLELAESEQHQPPFSLALERLADGYWRFQERVGDTSFGFDFLPQPADEAILADKSAFLQSDPSSGFVLTLVAQRRSRDRHVALRGRVLSTTTPTGIERETLDSAEAIVAALAEVFDLHLPEVAELWPRITARHEDYLRAMQSDPP